MKEIKCKTTQNISEIGLKVNLDELMKDRPSYCYKIGIMLTNRCNIRCRHCIFDCLPTDKKVLSRSAIFQIIAESVTLQSVGVIGFTGGEPFLEIETLESSINLCTEKGLNTSVTTNCFWANTKHKAFTTLRKLSGLTTINLSTDSFHQEYVPISNVINAISASAELNIECNVRVAYLNDPVSEIGKVLDSLSAVANLFKINHQPVQFTGRASKQIDSADIFYYDAAKVPCFGADLPLVDCNGDVTACCGAPANLPTKHFLRIGNIHERKLGDIMADADINPIIHILRIWGPMRLIELIKNQAKKKGFPVSLPSSRSFSDICSICEYILKNELLSRLLAEATKNRNLFHEVAIARLSNLTETSMLLKEPQS